MIRNASVVAEENAARYEYELVGCILCSAGELRARELRRMGLSRCFKESPGIGQTSDQV